MEVQVPGAGSRGLRRAAALAALALCAVAAGCGREQAGEHDGSGAATDEVVLTPEAAREGRAKHADEPKRRSKAQVV